MICYKDKTFCVLQTCERIDECDNHLNRLNKSELKRISIPLSMTDYKCDQTDEQTV